MSEYMKGFKDALQRCKEELEKIPYQTGYQLDIYLEWVWIDRPAYNVKQDCIDAISKIKYTEY